MPAKQISVYFSEKEYEKYLQDPEGFNKIGRDAIKKALQNKHRGNNK